MKLQQMFNTRPNATTITVSVTYLAIIFAALFFLMTLASCSILSREGSTSLCYSKKHYSGYGGQFKSHKMVKR